MNLLVIIFTVTLVLPNFNYGLPLDGDSGMVVVSEDTPLADEAVKPDNKPPQLKSMHVISNVRNRYAKTAVISKYANPDNRSQETTFSIILPDTAFISGFVMEIKGKKYEAYVKEKEEAQRDYQQAVSSGLGAAHVAVSARDSNKFTVSVNVEPLSKVTFNLTYEELLVRKHGKYEMVINLHPGQLVKDLGVDVNINETRPIIYVNTPAIRSGNEITDADGTSKNEYATTERVPDDKNVVHVHFTPTIEQQKEILKQLKENNEEKGIGGQFVVEYDVERDPQGGEVLVNDGYFVHFFAPSELKAIPKHVVFVLDVSGSMVGRKIEQLKQAMEIILGELSADDYFNLVKFHTDVQVLDKDNQWKAVEFPQESLLPQGIPATTDNIKNAQDIVRNMTDEGLTNIYDALIVGLRLTEKGTQHLKQEGSKHKPQPIIVFLTDGQANVGESRPDKMIEMVESRNNNNKAAVFTLAFGNDANKEFLKELAIKNSGFERNIYEASDAALQLQDFYKQISSPLLTNVHFKYADDVKEVTKHSFDILFKGSELVVAGKIDNPNEKFVSVEGRTLDGTNSFIPRIIPIIIRPEVKTEYGSLERLWAYMTIKQLLDKKYEAKDSDKNATDSESPEKQALKLALKYSFVTPITSLVVIKPNETVARPAEPAIPTFELDDSDALALSGAPYSGGAFYASPVQPLAGFGPVGGFGGGAGGLPLSLPPAARPAFAQAGLPGPPQYLTSTFRPPVSFTNSAETTLVDIRVEDHQDDLDKLPWLIPLKTNPQEIKLDNKNYLLGDNSTVVEEKSCQVEQLSGNCTLISACPRMFVKLDSLDSYKKYFCTLDSERYAGVCCLDLEDKIQPIP